jgi:hypothetical protein
MPIPKPISLSDSQLDAVMRACAVLPPHDRSAFLSALAHQLRGEEIGDGAVFRAIRELLHSRFFQAPQVTSLHQVPPRGEANCARTSRLSES